MFTPFKKKKRRIEHCDIPKRNAFSNGEGVKEGFQSTAMNSTGNLKQRIEVSYNCQLIALELWSNCFVCFF